MRGCLRFLAGVVAILFLLTAVLALFLTNLFTIFADRELIKSALADLDELAVEAVPSFVAQTLAEQARLQGLAPIDLDEAILQQSMTTLLPPGWIDQQTDTAVDTVYDLLESGDLENAELEIDTTPLLDRFRGTPGQDIVGIIINSLPPCADPINPADLFNGNVTIPACMPPGIPSEQIIQEVHTRLVQTLDSNPQLASEFGLLRISLFSPEQQAQNESLVQARGRLLRLQRTFSLAQRWGWLLWLLPITCLLLIVLLAVRSWSEWGHWWGWPLVATAVFVLFVALLFPAITTFMLRQLPAGQTAVTNSLLQTAVQLITAVTGTWLGRVYLQAGLMLVAGVLFVLLGVLTGGKQQTI